MTLKGRGDKTRTITLNGSTIYTLGKTKAAKSDLAVGSRVVVEGTVSGDTFTALTVHIALSSDLGEVTAKTASSITVKHRDGKTTVIHVASDTTFKVRGKDAATLADIAVGDRVEAQGTRRTDGSLDALDVQGRAPRRQGNEQGPRPRRPRPADSSRRGRDYNRADGLEPVYRPVRVRRPRNHRASGGDRARRHAPATHGRSPSGGSVACPT